MSIESERISADRCVDLGLSNRAVPAESLMEETLKWAQVLVNRAPLSLSSTKKAMRYAASHDWSNTFDVEVSLQEVLRRSEDGEEGVRSFFEKRKANFKGQ